MLKFDHLTAAQDNVRHASNDKDRLLVQLLTTMTDRIVQLEARLDHSILLLTELKAGASPAADANPAADELLPFADRVLAVIEDSSYTAFTHIEAEIDEKLSDFLDSNSFNEAISDAVRTVSGLSSTIEEILDGLLHDAIIDAIGDPEDIVRKGLRSIL